MRVNALLWQGTFSSLAARRRTATSGRADKYSRYLTASRKKRNGNRGTPIYEMSSLVFLAALNVA